MELSPDQRDAVDIALRAINDGEPCLITGRAGTGKTTTLKALVEDIKASGLSVMLVAFTNKAADVIRQKLDMGADEVTTSHRLLYQSEMRMRIGAYDFSKKVGEKILEELEADKDFELLRDQLISKLDESEDRYEDRPLVDDAVEDVREAFKAIDYGQECVTTRIDNPDPNLVVICDETSMLPSPSKDEILEAYPRVVFVGDYRQIPPVDGPDTIVDLITTVKNQAELTTVFRSGDVILELAERAEQGKPLGGETITRDMFKGLVEWGAKFIIPTNKMVFNCNMAARRLTGKSGPSRPGEPLMTTARAKAFLPSYRKGDHTLFSMLNSRGPGNMAMFDAWPCDVHGKPDFARFGSRREIRNARIMNMPADEVRETLFFIKEYVVLQKNTEVEQVGKAFKYGNAESWRETACLPIKYGDQTAYLPCTPFWAYDLDDWLRARADGSMKIFFSYAMTVHRAQGSEYDTVVMQPCKFGDHQERMNYTAITRAKKKCVVARSFRLAS